ncbi:MAG TPA: metalloregulator ArsR/SmtB family transcription factor [Leucothrix mucor]|uniref:Metalloregulator ArsR/SmtB family transcription factor n=1 Tax=Leucothrix mucor TaxID=45248 RepID=A0A7V2SY23_LEUMU|nr:metalloregulator ArsR/SmtB family transcription factor [Leucothrix mucor]
MQLTQFTKILSDETRLRILMLLTQGQELCVCQLTAVLNLSQPKISRHLAIMREAKLLQDRKAGLWVFYRLNSEIPDWILEVFKSLHEAALSQQPFETDHQLIASPRIKQLANCSD